MNAELWHVAVAAPAFTTKVPEEPEKAIYPHWYITETREGTQEDMSFGPFPAKKCGVDFLQPADEQHEAEVAGENLTCMHVYAT